MHALVSTGFALAPQAASHHSNLHVLMRLSIISSLSWRSAISRHVSNLRSSITRNSSHIPHGRRPPRSEPPSYVKKTSVSPGLDQMLNLPRSCPGCGAFSQNISSDQPGYYDLCRKPVRAYIAWSSNVQAELEETNFDLTSGLTRHDFPDQAKSDQGLNFS